ncbi:MAG: hypothetical protein M3257_07955 [Actinomycetota bacterium]|nr:hypothetical protein [Actinomycetota bacterium]
MGRAISRATGDGQRAGRVRGNCAPARSGDSADELLGGQQLVQAVVVLQQRET